MSNFALANRRRAPLFERQALFASCESSTSLQSQMLFGCFVVWLFLLFVKSINKLTKQLNAKKLNNQKRKNCNKWIIDKPP